MPVGLLLANKRFGLIKLPPHGSVLLDVAKVIRTGFSQPKLKGEVFYESAKPSNIELAGGLKKGKPRGWISWDDDFVDELKRTFKACRIFVSTESRHPSSRDPSARAVVSSRRFTC